MRGLVPATSPCDKAQGQVPLCELAFFASKSSRKDQLQSLRLVLRIQTSLNFLDKSLRLVPQNASCELFMGPVPTSSPFVQTLQGTSCREQSQGLVPSYVPNLTVASRVHCQGVILQVISTEKVTSTVDKYTL